MHERFDDAKGHEIVAGDEDFHGERVRASGSLLLLVAQTGKVSANDFSNSAKFFVVRGEKVDGFKQRYKTSSHFLR